MERQLKRAHIKYHISIMKHSLEQLENLEVQARYGTPQEQASYYKTLNHVIDRLYELEKLLEIT